MKKAILAVTLGSLLILSACGDKNVNKNANVSENKNAIEAEQKPVAKEITRDGEKAKSNFTTPLTQWFTLQFILMTKVLPVKI